MSEGNKFLDNTSRKSLRILGSVGEPINPEAWRWYYDDVGNSECSIVDTWWQTETGGIMITPLVGAIDMKPGSATLPFFGIKPSIVDQDNQEIKGRELNSMYILKGVQPFFLLHLNIEIFLIFYLIRKEGKKS